MQSPIHAISAPATHWTTERIAGVGFVGFLHVLAIYALVTGLAQKIIKVIPPDLVVTMDPVQQQKPDPVAPLKPTDLPTLPMDQTVPEPQIVIADDTPSRFDVPLTPANTTPSAPDAAAASIASTHTTPPYPGLARKMGEQGTVKLRLTISPQGVVTLADVVQTSGFPDLDQTAVNWVLANWKYKPAVRGGVAVASTALAAVVFSLKTAR